MSIAFLVKHVARKRGPLADRFSAYCTQPYSLTSKGNLALRAKLGATIYVVESLPAADGTRYRVGYRYVCRRADPSPPDSPWDGQFQYRNAADEDLPEGICLPVPAAITDEAFTAWCRNLTPGMQPLPEVYSHLLDRILEEPSAGAVILSVSGTPLPSK